jgi:hypothetical protein
LLLKIIKYLLTPRAIAHAVHSLSLTCTRMSSLITATLGLELSPAPSRLPSRCRLTPSTPGRRPWSAPPPPHCRLSSDASPTDVARRCPADVWPLHHLRRADAHGQPPTLGPPPPMPLVVARPAPDRPPMPLAVARPDSASPGPHPAGPGRYRPWSLLWTAPTSPGSLHRPFSPAPRHQDSVDASWPSPPPLGCSSLSSSIFC